MNYEILFAFLVGMVILAASPGPGVFASVAKAISSGFIDSLWVISGLVVGDIIFLVLAILGMSTISIFMGELFFIIKIIGGCYLIYLGIKSFRSKTLIAEIETKIEKKSNSQNFTVGFLVTMGNPKPILFYASVLPSIINFEEVLYSEVLVMILLIAIVSFIVLGGYCYFASLSRKLITTSKAAKRFNRGAGAVMTATGIYVITK